MSSVRETTSIKLDKTIKAEAKIVLAKLGISMGDAVNMFLAQVSHTQSIPFEIKIPNKETKKVFDEILAEKNVDDLSLDELQK